MKNTLDERMLAAALDAEIKHRLRDYADHDVTTERDKLIDLWRKHHPEAAKEVSVALHPLMLLESRKQPLGNSLKEKKESDEIWANDVYQVALRRRSNDPVFGTDGGMIQLGIHALDGTARHDWREFQAIKNQLAGPECEAFELYPAESRLIDPSNYFTLWCFPGVKRLKIGLNERRVFDADHAVAPQRDLPPAEEP